MASFERGMERFLVPVAIKLNSQKHVAAVRDGFVFTFPIIMASSLIILINFAILSPDGFIAGLLHLNSIFPNPDFRPYKKASRKTNINQPRLLKYQRHLPSLITSKMKTVNRTRLPQRIL